jgi:hypothetical protein
MIERAEHESPFENPPLTDGYPLDAAERDALEHALHELEAPDTSGDVGQAPAEPPKTGAAA